MKKYYCDNCHKEMQYSDAPVTNTNGSKHTRLLKDGKGNALEVSVSIHVEARKHIKALDERGHADLCGECRWRLVDSLRYVPPKGGLPTDAKGNIDWDAGTGQL